MNELRQDPTTRNWVIMAPARHVRPHDAEAGTPSHPDGPSGCPFCPGNEAATPPELWRLGDRAGWRIRVVPNKFPALMPQHGAVRSNRRTLLTMTGHGHHEVVIESPRHDWDMSTGDEADVLAVLRAYRARYRALQRAADTGLIVIFRNHGPASGTSLDHPHSQILATPIVPLLVRHRLNVARQHFDDIGTCLYVESVGRELAEGSRIVASTGRLAAFEPFASTVPFETWISPCHHAASFGDVSDDTLQDLARLLTRVLYGLREALDDPPYNLVIHSAPIGEEATPYFAWYVQIVPRVSTPAGFELGTGIPINTVLPEDAAAELRARIGERVVTGRARSNSSYRHIHRSPDAAPQPLPSGARLPSGGRGLEPRWVRARDEEGEGDGT